ANPRTCQRQRGYPQETAAIVSWLREHTSASAMRGRRSGHAVPSSSALRRLFAQRPEARPNFFRKQLRLFPGGKVPAFRECVEMDEIGVGALGPTPRSLVDLFRENADGRWN